MPVLNSTIKGSSGYSGYSPITIGVELLSQNTFTPAHDSWEVDGDCSFVDNVPTYNVSMSEGDGYGGLQQTADWLVESIKENTTYQLTITFQNLIIGDLIIIVFFDDNVSGTQLIPQNGENIFFIKSTTVDDLSPIYLFAGGTTGSFEITSMSLKEYDNLEGYFGYSGRSGKPFPAGANVETATAETIVAQFNALLTSLKNGQYMEEEPEG